MGEYSETSIFLSPGDSVLLYTDGILEIFHSENRNARFGELTQSVIDLLKGEDLVKEVTSIIERFIEKNGKFAV